MAVERTILEKIKTLLTALPWVKVVKWDQVQPDPVGIDEHELPCIQLIAGPAQVARQGANLREHNWDIVIELVMRTTEAGVVTQADLLDKKGEVEAAIDADPTVTVTGGMYHVIERGWEPDVLMVDAYMAVRILYTAKFLKSTI